MAPTTRSASASQPKASSSKHTLDDRSTPVLGGHSGPDDEHEPEPRRESTLQGLLERALRGAISLEEENEDLRKKVKALEGKLDRIQENDDILVSPARATRKSAANISGLQRQVERLKGEVRTMRKAEDKFRKRIHELSMREIKKEAEDLEEDVEFEAGDSAYKMRKLLREFHDLMLANVLSGEETEECPICFDKLEPNKCRSLPCQHMYCDSCTAKLDLGTYDYDVETIRCPECRSQWRRDEAETVEYTAVQQWDALLAVANKWAKVDVRREEDTDEEEGEEGIIDDGVDDTNTTSTTASEPPLANILETSSEADDPEQQPQTPVRIRKRPVVTTPAISPEPEPGSLPRHQSVEEDGARKALIDVKLEDPSTPPPTEAGPSSQPEHSYKDTPRKDKRKKMEELAAARAKKRRL